MSFRLWWQGSVYGTAQSGKAPRIASYAMIMMRMKRFFYLFVVGGPKRLDVRRLVDERNFVVGEQIYSEQGEIISFLISNIYNIHSAAKPSQLPRANKILLQAFGRNQKKLLYIWRDSIAGASWVFTFQFIKVCSSSCPCEGKPSLTAPITVSIHFFGQGEIPLITFTQPPAPY